MPSETTTLARHETRTSAIAPVNVANLLTDIVKSGMTAEAAGAVKELVLLQEHQEDRFAKQLWLEAFTRVRGKLKTINAVKAVPDKHGNARWYYAPLEDLQDEVEPILATEDLTIRFDSTRDGAICTGVCWLSHISGHEESSKCAINAGNAQGGDLGALKIAKRGAMVAMLALKTRADSDARMLGDFVSPDMADELRTRLMATGRNERKFLALAGVNVPDDVAPSFDDWKRIRQGKIGVLHQALAAAESAKRTSVPSRAKSESPEPDVSGSQAEPPPSLAGREAFMVQLDEIRESAGISDKKAFANEIKKWALAHGVVGKEHKAAPSDVQKLLEDIANRVGAFG